MAGLKDLGNVWQSIKEMDLRPIREEALQEVHLAIVGRAGTPKQELAWQMRRDPHRPAQETLTPILILDYEGDDSALTPALEADLLILLASVEFTEFSMEQKLAQKWLDSGRRLLVIVHTANPSQLEAQTSHPALFPAIAKGRLLLGDVRDTNFLLSRFVPAVLEALPHKSLALARQFPLFRDQVSRQLLSEGCLTNATYAFSTGLAEIVPGLNIPLNVADVVVLTKNQAFMAYRLGLALGLSTRWQDYVTEFGGVLGSGFFWRQVARQLIGLIPAWGIIPKVAIAYAGTYVVGRVILQWYLTGKQLTPQQMRQLYVEAFQKGQAWAKNLLEKVPKPGLLRRKPQVKELALPPEPLSASRACPNCGKHNDPEAHFCQYCGVRLEDMGTGSQS
ncbi:MAG: zinc ribbon domain-containing protein [Anaerolineales bacterium]